MLRYSGMTRTELEHELNLLQITVTTANQDLLQSQAGTADLQQLLHELHVHQIELEMQNRELLETRQELEASHNRYFALYDFAPFGYLSLDDKGCIQEINLTGALMLGKERHYLIGKPFVVYVAKGETHQFLEHIRRCQHGEQKVMTELLLKGDSAKSVQLLSVPVQDEASQGEFFRTALVDISERRQAQASLQQSLAQHQALLHALPDMMFRMNYDGIYLDFHAEKTNELLIPPSLIIGSSIHQTMPAKIVEKSLTALRLVQKTGQLQTIEYRLEQSDEPQDYEARFVAGSDQDVIVIVRNITMRKQVELAVEERTAALASANAALSAEVVERTAAEERVRMLLQKIVTAQEEARRRISRELHDQTGQYFVALRLVLQGLKDTLREEPDKLALLQQAEEISERLGRDVSAVARELRPAGLEEFGLINVLNNYIEEWASRSGVNADFHAHGAEQKRLSDEIEITIYRVIQEALTNTLKHANSRHVSVVLEYLPHCIRVIVEDDGRGFSVEPTNHFVSHNGKLGLLGMRERLALVGGSLEIESSSDSGSTLFINIPLTLANKAENDDAPRA